MHQLITQAATRLPAGHTAVGHLQNATQELATALKIQVTGRAARSGRPGTAGRTWRSARRRTAGTRARRECETTSTKSAPSFPANSLALTLPGGAVPD